MTSSYNYFTKIDSEEFIKFEENIAFFYFAKNTELIKKHYIQAITEFESSQNKKLNIDEIQKLVLPHLENAYLHVQKETDLNFDLKLVAKIEFDLISAQSNQDSFEQIQKIMTNLYSTIFKKDNIHIYKAATLRTFLYQYKIKMINKNNVISQGDMELLEKIAKHSEQELASLI